MIWTKIRPFLLSSGVLLLGYGCAVDKGYTFGGGAGRGGEAGDGSSGNSGNGSTGKGGSVSGLTGGRSSSGAGPMSGGRVAAGATGSGATGEPGGGSDAGGATSGGRAATGGSDNEAGAGDGTGGEPPCVGPCADECTPDAMQCNDLQPQVCDENGEWQDFGSPCPTLCEDGVCHACEPGAKQCNALQPQVCNGGVWEAAGTACPFVCDPDSGECVGVCTPGAKACDDLQPQICDENGVWTDTGTACTDVCNGGTCTACNPGAKQCNGLQPQVCGDDGLWENSGTACEFVCNATTGACAGSCKPDAKRCDSLQPQVCDATGTWKNSGSSCQFVCNGTSGTCSGSCTPTHKQCAGAQPQVCSATGVWGNAGSACGTCNPCSPSTGVCVANTGATCSDNNACTMGDICQAGVCMAGTPMNCNTNPCKTGQTCSNGSCSAGNNRAKGYDCSASGAGKECDGSGTCKCRVKSSWNDLINPGFDGNASGWTLGSGASYNAANDIRGCQGSGAIYLTSLTSFNQCLDTTPGVDHYFGYRFKPAAGTSSYFSTCSVQFYSAGTACDSANYISGTSINGTDSGSGWASVEGSMEAPIGTRFVRFNCSSAAATGYYDDMYLANSTPSGDF